MSKEKINDFLKSSFGFLPARIALAIMAWFGFINLYMTRVNVSVIIVAMVRRNASAGSLAPCQLALENSTLESTEFALNISESQTPSVISQPQIAKDVVMDWDEKTQGFVLGSFFIGYLMTQIVGGRLAELYGTKWVFGSSILGGGIIALLSPFAAKLHYGFFIALRIVHGVLQGVSWPSMHACLSQWIPPLERPRFIAIVYFGATLSTAITLPLCGLIIDAYGWSYAFYVTGSLSLVWCVVWFTFMYSYPAQHPRISPQELQYIELSLKESGTSTDSEGQSKKVPWRAIFTSVPMWALIIGDFGNSWGIALLYSQLPTYMKNILGFSIKANGALSALPFVARYVGAILLSSLADWVLARGYLSIRSTRRLFSTLAMWTPAVMLLGVTFSGCNWEVIVVMFCIGLFVNGAITASTLVNPTDIAPNFSGTLMGITNTTSTLAAFLVPVVTGFITDGQQTIEQWQKVFWICVPMYIVMHIIFFIFCSGDVQPWNYAGQSTRVQREKESLRSDEEVLSLTTETKQSFN